MKDKNLYPVFGKPLLYYPAMAAKRSSQISLFFTSSDDDRILDAAHKLGYKKIKRPRELSRSDSQHGDVIIHALDQMKGENCEPEFLVVLLANGACIKTKWIDDCINILKGDSSLSSASPVYMDNDSHPFRAKTLNEKGLLVPFLDLSGRSVSTNRQELPPNYFFCHNFWVLRVANSVIKTGGQPPWKFMGENIHPYFVDKVVDVHDEHDISLVEKWLQNETVESDSVESRVIAGYRSRYYR